jgi:hypothetical protein
MADDLARIARERAVMTTIADIVVAAAVGKSLRVAVGGGQNQIRFADQLTRALHARGRACRCLASTTPAAHAEAAAGCQAVVVITSGPPGPDETEQCCIHIHLHATLPGRRAANRSGPAAAAGGHPSGDDGPDIIVDYDHPDGAVIRHIGPDLPAPPPAVR